MTSRKIYTRHSRRTSSLNPRRPTTNREGGSLDRNNNIVLSRQRRIFKPISDCPSEGIAKECAYIRRLNHQSDIQRWYDIGGVIGHGNFSHVFSAVRRCDQSKSAIKVTLCYNNSVIDRLQQINKRQLRGQLYFVENEVDILKSCEHKYICQLRDAFESSSAYILVFEFAPNGDLFETLKSNGRLHENDAAYIIAQRSIVHRDVKPENLLLTENRSVKLADFGLACTVLGPLYRICGTPTYVAPEILAEKGYGVSVDVWSLGVILHLMLVGYAPFRCSDRRRLFRIILKGRLSFDYPAWSHISHMAKVLVSKLLTTDVSKRLTSAEVCTNKWVLTAATDRDIERH